MAGRMDAGDTSGGCPTTATAGDADANTVGEADAGTLASCGKEAFRSTREGPTLDPRQSSILMSMHSPFLYIAIANAGCANLLFF
jgi:hypothetical protein